MGGALLRRAAGLGAICVVEPHAPPDDLKNLPRVTWVSAPEQIPDSFTPDVVILAVKPQQMASALPAYARYAPRAVFVSIAAGTTILRLRDILKNHAAAIVRAMPNLPASIGAGVSVAVASDGVSADQRALGDNILKAFGAVEWIADEVLLDAVTALSGSGPAYVFALAEAMAAAGAKLGLPLDLATRLARQTLIGSGALLAQSSDSAEALRVAVTSRGGTTEAALKHLLAPGGLPDLLDHAMRAAAERGKQLSP